MRLMAVSKKVPPDAVNEAVGCGLALFGESRIQEAAQKIPLCPGSIEWHMVGHLQRNKVRDAVRLFRMIHSVDSLKLLEEIEKWAAENGATMPVLLEINVSGEASKFGMKPEDAEGVLKQCGRLMHIEVAGLMTMPPFTEDPEGARAHFRKLRELRDKLRSATGFELKELSMGMSHDFETAIEEGATFIRLGTVLFGERV